MIVIDSGGANISSLMNALERVGIQGKLSSQWEEIQGANRLILPGVGSALSNINRLKELGLWEKLPRLTAPLLGICVGMQMLYTRLEEGQTEGLGLLPGSVNRLKPKGLAPVPHMGWNQITTGDDPLFNNIENQWFYFTHSYGAEDDRHSLATVDYQQQFCAAVRWKNFWGVQFHPEKSASSGETLLKNFGEMTL